MNSTTSLLNEKLSFRQLYDDAIEHVQNACQIEETGRPTCRHSLESSYQEDIQVGRQPYSRTKKNQGRQAVA
jgi:hypothetical protein